MTTEPCKHKRVTYGMPQQCVDCGANLGGEIQVLSPEEHMALRPGLYTPQQVKDLAEFQAQCPHSTITLSTRPSCCHCGKRLTDEDQALITKRAQGKTP